MQPLCRSSDVALFGDSDEVLELGEAHGLTSLTRALVRVQYPKGIGAHAQPLSPWAMRIERLGALEVGRLRAAGRVAAATLALIGERLRPGMTTGEIDRLVRQDTRRRGARPSQLGYRPHRGSPAFPAAVCTSVNDVVCHGIPGERVLEEGEIVGVDVTSELDAFHGDTCATFVVGEASAEARHVVEVARRCRDVGIAEVRPGARLGDIGAAIEALARAEGCSVVREVGGHGIGRRMHMPPHVAHHGRRGTGLRLASGMAFTIEPMVNLGGPEIVEADDGWTLRTRDGSLSAQFEHTLLVTDSGYEVMTLAI